MRLSLSSVRANTLSPKLVRVLVKRGARSVTIAVESGPQRMRDVVNKKLRESEMDAAISTAVRVVEERSSTKLHGSNPAVSAMKSWVTEKVRAKKMKPSTT
uniref:Uncharacterized protein n=1 Tax=Erythrolobus madagascarensis TaxID=708628 RepID=A0A6T9YPE0_9RHOD|mmetsp:Transcript_1905/g.4189  ORF Transcript_1905/g.4189 Transcript_1905/m.4189 type:complete len:101 (+) Transcript_1905:175-477(+)